MVRAGHRSIALLAACFGLAAVAGCAAPGATRPAATGAGHPVAPTAPSSSARPAAPVASTSSPPPTGVNVAAFDALARQEATAWARSPLAKVWRTGLVVLLADDLSSGPSSGFPSDEDKEAFINGNLVFTGPAPSGAPDGVVTWSDGSTVKVPVLSESRVFGELTSSRQCPDCATTPLAVTAARPTTLDVPTSRGPASVPAWAFTLKGVSTPVIQAALAPGSYVTPYTYSTRAEKLGPVGSSFVGGGTVTASADGRTLTVGLSGSLCDTTWGGLFDEVGGVVVIGGWMHHQHPDQSCVAVLVQRQVTVQLAAPLGGRVVLDAATGQPVPPSPSLPAPRPS